MKIVLSLLLVISVGAVAGDKTPEVPRSNLYRHGVKCSPKRYDRKPSACNAMRLEIEKALAEYNATKKGNQ